MLEIANSRPAQAISQPKRPPAHAQHARSRSWTVQLDCIWTTMQPPLHDHTYQGLLSRWPLACQGRSENLQVVAVVKTSIMYVAALELGKCCQKLACQPRIHSSMAQRCNVNVYA